MCFKMSTEYIKFENPANAVNSTEIYKLDVSKINSLEDVKAVLDGLTIGITIDPKWKDQNEIYQKLQPYLVKQ